MLVAAAQAHQIPNHCLIQYGHLFHWMNHLFLPAVPFSFVNERSSFFSFVVLPISFLYDDDVITAESPALRPRYETVSYYYPTSISYCNQPVV